MTKVERLARSLAQPKVLLSLAVSAAILAALLAFGDVRQVAGAATRLRPGTVLVFVGCLVAYELLRGAQWCFLLRALRVRAPLRAQVVAFGAGEILKDIPLGAFLQNYVLRESRGAAVARSSAATLFILGGEVLVALLVVVVLGAGTWLWPAAIAALVAVGIVGLLAAAERRYHIADTVGRWLPPWITRRPAARRAMRVVADARGGLADLLTARVLVVSLLAATACELLAAAALFALLRGIGETSLGFSSALVAHGFGVAVALLLPLPVDFGALEVSGVAALLAVGLPKGSAVAAMVLNRALSIGVALLIAAVLAAAFRGEVRRAWESRQEPSPLAETEPRGRRRHAGRLSGAHS